MQDDVFRCHLLVTPKLRPVPKNISVIDNWGELTIINEDSKERICGQHMFIETDTADEFEAWVSGEDVWIGTGHPQFQRFILESFPATSLHESG